MDNFYLHSTFKTSVLAKEKGFDLPCREFYYSCGKIRTASYWEGNNNDGWLDNDEIDEYMHDSHRGMTIVCTAPELSTLSYWLREKHCIHVTVTFYPFTHKYDDHYIYSIDYKKDGHYRYHEFSGDSEFSTHEKCLDYGIREALILINKEL